MTTAQLLDQELGWSDCLSSQRKWKETRSEVSEPRGAFHKPARSREKTPFATYYEVNARAGLKVKHDLPKTVGEMVPGSTVPFHPWHQTHGLYSPTSETNLAAGFKTTTSVDPVTEEVPESFTPLHWPPSPTQAESRPPSDALHHEADDLEASQAVADRFQELADRWEDESMFLSNSGHALALPSYDAIVKLGDQAVPLILKRMQTRGGHWYHALHDITKEDPVDPADWGNVAAMQAAWLRWGRDHGSI